MSNIFTEKISHYNTRKPFDFEIPFSNTVKFGAESLKYLGPKIWNLVPEQIKMTTTLPLFKGVVPRKIT